MAVEWAAFYPFNSLLSLPIAYFSAATSLTRVRIIRQEFGIDTIETLNRVIVLLYAYHGP